MADWKQITARIRRARTSKDPAGQLSALYEKTRDAMVAFELAKYFETSAQNADASKWYATAAERFRRADWKTKAQEAAVRLGGEPSASEASPAANGNSQSPVPVAADDPDLYLRQNASAVESMTAVTPAEPTDLDTGGNDADDATEAGAEGGATAPGADADEKRRRRRGRRGGRNRRKSSLTTATKSSSGAIPAAASSGTSRRGSAPPAAAEEMSEPEARASRPSMPPLPIEALPDSGVPGPKGRYGDPGLSSRISLLEMQFRRLLSCPAAKLEETNHAPVGPGVFVLTDSDLTSYYYVEACQTLRIAVANLLRGNSSKRGTESITKQLAEHLGIAESRVPKYLGEHCVVRWLQLDEGASHFAHFVIAVLRPVLNE
jgi:hypothetical protein